MRITIATALSVVAFVAAAAAMLAAPEQTLTPGQMTQAKVWVQNRGVGEAVPVDLRETNLAAPLQVHVVNGEPGRGATAPLQVHVVNGEAARGAGPTPLLVRAVRPVWDYQMVTVTANQDLAAALNAHGASGWETTGVVFADGAGTRVLMKRLR
jgi:hypothetical protein